jgi:phosphate transport system substrate-binding protein
MNLREHLALHDGIAVIVHPRFPVEEITLDQLGKIYGGAYAHWSQLGGPNLPITIWALNREHSSTANTLDEFVLKGIPLARNAKVVRRFKPLIDSVSNTEGAIGYISYLYLIDDRGPDTRVVKMLKIKKEEDSETVTPSKATINSRAYPLGRDLYFCWEEIPYREWLRRFVEFCRPELM